MKTLLHTIWIPIALVLGMTQELEAQPRILVAPNNVAAELGANVQFAVTAFGSGTLTYQWRFHGSELEGATSRILEIADVGLNDLGRYDVIVRDSAEETISHPCYLLLASRWTELVYFGASEGLSRCPGPAWPEYTAKRLGVTLRNYATGGASSSGVQSQIHRYLDVFTPSHTTLIAFYFGGAGTDMLFDQIPPEQAAEKRLANLRLLAEAGAREFLLLHGYKPEMAPGIALQYPHVTSESCQLFFHTVETGLETLRSEYVGLATYVPDIFALAEAVWDDPGGFGFSNPEFSPDGSFVWPDFTCDGLHLMTAAHKFIAQEAYQSLTAPLTVQSATLTPDGDLELLWTGGSSPFRIERSTDLRSDQWIPVEEVQSLPGVIVPRNASNEFYRVLFLGQ